MMEPHLFFSTGEIDRCLKKVAEGVEQFEDIWQKVKDLCIVHLFNTLFQKLMWCNLKCLIVFVHILAPQCSQCKPEGKI